MEYIYGTIRRDGVMVENLKTVGAEHTDLAGYIETQQDFGSAGVITDRCRILEHYHTDEADGLCYDWYLIDRHYRYVCARPEDTQAAQASREAAEIVFVTMAEGGSIDAATAAEHAELFSPWAWPVAYTAGQIRRYLDGKLYRCLQDHTSQETWTPDAAGSLWVSVADPAEEWPDWSQPVASTDAYAAGAKVSRGGKHWTSDVDNNVWEPGVYGWTEAA